MCHVFGWCRALSVCGLVCGLDMVCCSVSCTANAVTSAIRLHLSTADREVWNVPVVQMSGIDQCTNIFVRYDNAHHHGMQPECVPETFIDNKWWENQNSTAVLELYY
eukprot:Lankesteria_metandrocarpae@DN451_c0_g1_i1.p1